MTALAYCSSFFMSGPPIMYWTSPALMPPPEMTDTGVTLIRRLSAAYFGRMFFRTKSIISNWPNSRSAMLTSRT